MNPFQIIYYHLYLLQLENYDCARYGRALIHRWFPPHELRQKITGTVKLTITETLALALQFIVAYALARNLAALLTVIALSYIHAIFLIAATIILLPVDALAKYIIIAKAKKKLQSLTNRIPTTTHHTLNAQPMIIAITGSCGKTTMKEILAAILQEKYTVLKTPDNVNTPLGIARLILTKLTPNIQIFIVEMGAYHTGDIKQLCELMPPDIAIVTGVNETHLERFGAMENTIAAKFEVVDYAKKDALIVINADNQLIMKHYARHRGGRKTVRYSAYQGIPLPKIQLLGDYAKGAVRGAIQVAETLGIPQEQSARVSAMLKPLPHRLQPIITPENILIIDDSYNGNPDGAREAMRVLRRYTNRRKIYITPGLVETGEQNKNIHEALGKELATTADLIILIKNSATAHMKTGLLTAQYPKEHIREFKNALEAHRALPNIVHSGDVILFQNDWPDNYN